MGRTLLPVERLAVASGALELGGALEPSPALGFAIVGEPPSLLGLELHALATRRQANAAPGLRPIVSASNRAMTAARCEATFAHYHNRSVRFEL